MDKKIFIGFDFSINKPAATICYAGKLYFYFWPLNLDQKKLDSYSEAGVNATSRGLEPIDKKKKKEIDNSQLVLIHTIRSTELANLIISDIDKFIEEHIEKTSECELYISTEGLSYNSYGDVTLNLATYKGVLLSKIYEHFGDNLTRLFTYSPNTIKAVAGCSAKKKASEKKNMVQAFCENLVNSPLTNAIREGRLTAKTNYIDGVDDLADSYWALKTMIIKEKYVI